MSQDAERQHDARAATNTLPRPARAQVEQVEQVRGEHQHPDADQVLAGGSALAREHVAAPGRARPTAFSMPVLRLPASRPRARGRASPRGASGSAAAPAGARPPSRSSTQPEHRDPDHEHAARRPSLGRERVGVGELLERRERRRAPAARASDDQHPGRRRQHERRGSSRAPRRRARGARAASARAARPARATTSSGSQRIDRTQRHARVATSVGRRREQALGRALHPVLARPPPSNTQTSAVLPAVEVEVVHARDRGSSM